MAERHFTHLSRIEIRDILVSHHKGEPKLQIAKRLGIDNSTVHYHIRKHEQAYSEDGSVYALIKDDFRKECTHPSLKCFLCGAAQDNIKREEKLVIYDLRNKLATANLRLEHAGLEPI